MSDAYVLERPRFFVNKCSVDFLEDIETFYHLSEDRSFAIEVVKIVTEADQELACGFSSVRVVWGWGGGHADHTTVGVFELGMEFWSEGLLWRWIGFAVTVQQTPYRGTAITLSLIHI